MSTSSSACFAKPIRCSHRSPSTFSQSSIRSFDTLLLELHHLQKASKLRPSTCHTIRFQYSIKMINIQYSINRRILRFLLKNLHLYIKLPGLCHGNRGSSRPSATAPPSCYPHRSVRKSSWKLKKDGTWVVARRLGAHNFFSSASNTRCRLGSSLQRTLNVVPRFETTAISIPKMSSIWPIRSTRMWRASP